MRSSNDLRGLVDLCYYVRGEIGKNAIVVEIGSLVGESTFELALHFSRVYAIDTWDYPNTEIIFEGNKGEVERYFDSVAAYMGNITKIKSLSVDAGKLWKGPAIDLLYVDGSHKKDDVYADLTTWTPHVRKGGFAAGHDWGHPKFPGVVEAVREVLGEPDATFADNSWVKRL